MKKHYYYTYKITCTKGSYNGKVYFGKRTTTKDPNKDKYKGSGKILKDYYQKYPNGYIKIILDFYNSLEELNKAEYELIHPHLGKDYCLNIVEGGGGCSLSGEQNGFYGKTHSDEQKQKWSEMRKGTHPSDETRKLLSEVHKGKHSWNKGITGYHHKKQRTDEYREKQRQSHLGKRLTDETKKKQSISHLEYYKTHAGPNKGKTFSEEWRRNCGNSTRGKHRVYDNEEHTKWHLE